jgi:hypothetical protein
LKSECQLSKNRRRRVGVRQIGGRHDRHIRH